MLAPGAVMGDGSIAAMGALVAGVVPPGVVVGGNPARRLRERDVTHVRKMVEEERYYLRAVLEEGLRRSARKVTK
jgi:acetyltransferase-like isoleucine patch superfamily enzyme